MVERLRWGGLVASAGGPPSPVAMWLRSLRLHKYNDQLQHIEFTYLLYVTAYAPPPSVPGRAQSLASAR